VSEKPQFSYENAEIVGERLTKLFEGLDKERTMASIEDFIDDYTHAIFGVSIIDALRRVKFPGKGMSQCIQPLAEGRALLVSSYGFNVKTDTNCKCGRAFIVLDEMTRKDRDEEMEKLGG
jgi:hypothetical protein